MNELENFVKYIIDQEDEPDIIIQEQGFSTEQLVHLLESSDSELRGWVLSTIRKYRVNEVPFELYVKMLKDTDGIVKIEALSALLKCNTDIPLVIIEPLLTDPDEDVRSLAIRRTAIYDLPPYWIETFKEIITDAKEPSSVRHAAICRMATEKELLPIFVGLALTQPDLQYAAIDALKNFKGDASAIQALREILSHGKSTNIYIRRDALKALAEIDSSLDVQNIYKKMEALTKTFTPTQGEKLLSRFYCRNFLFVLLERFLSSFRRKTY